jgi:isopenicillin-N N-acyltransferase like protein
MPYAGELAVLGFSTTGVSSFGNSLFLKGHKPSPLPSTVFRRLCLEASNVDEVIALKERYGSGGGGNHLIGDGTGRAVAIEGSVYGQVVLEQRNGIIVHANNALSHLKQYENWAPEEIARSQNRVNRLTAFYEAESGRISPMLAFRGLIDHDNYPVSLCRHIPPGDRPGWMEFWQTTAALVCEPTLKRLHAIRGQPCRGFPATYCL